MLKSKRHVMTARDGSLPHGGRAGEKGVRTQEWTQDRGVGIFCQSERPGTPRLKCAESHCRGGFLLGAFLTRPTCSLS